MTIFLFKQDDGEERYRHHDSGYESSDTCAGDAKFRESHITIDETEVKEDIQDIAAYSYQHGIESVAETFKELFECHKQKIWYQRQCYSIIITVKNLKHRLRLSEVSQQRIYDKEKHAKGDAYHAIKQHRVLEQDARLLTFVSRMMDADERREAHRDAETYHRDIKYDSA